MTDGAKNELRKDICVFSNNRGGYIFVGVREITSRETELIGVPNHEIYNQEFIEQIVSSGNLKPPILNVKMHKIQYNSNYYIIIEVPESKTAPHFLNGKIPFRFGKITKYFDNVNEWKKAKKPS